MYIYYYWTYLHFFLFIGLYYKDWMDEKKAFQTLSFGTPNMTFVLVWLNINNGTKFLWPTTESDRVQYKYVQKL